MLIGRTKFIPTSHMANSKWEKKVFPLHPCQGPRHRWIVDHSSVQGHIQTPHSSLHDLSKTICSSRFCYYSGNPNRQLGYKSLCPWVLQLPLGSFQLPRTLTQKEGPRLIFSLRITGFWSLCFPSVSPTCSPLCCK